MYRIIGGDGQEYGPINADQVRLWIAEGRLNGQSQIRAEDSPDWKPLNSFPEFAGAPPALASFGAPAPVAPSFPVSAVPGPAEAKARVSGPAIGLLVTGIISVLLSLGSLVMHGTIVLGMRAVPVMPAPTPELTQLFNMLNSLNGPIGLISDVFSLTMSGLITFGALKMKNLQSYTFAYTVSILAMIPCLSPCCLLGLPFGIWALVVLNKPEIKSQFN